MAIKNNSTGTAKLWAGWWIAALAWAFHLMASFVLIDWYCHNDVALSAAQISTFLHAISAFSLLLACSSLMLAWKNGKQLRNSKEVEKQRVIYQSRYFLSHGGLVVSIFFIATIVMQSWSNFVLGPCQ